MLTLSFSICCIQFAFSRKNHTQLGVYVNNQVIIFMGSIAPYYVQEKFTQIEDPT
jgi:hypothetical protein